MEPIVIGTLLIFSNYGGRFEWFLHSSCVILWDEWTTKLYNILGIGNLTHNSKWMALEKGETNSNANKTKIRRHIESSNTTKVLSPFFPICKQASQSLPHKKARKRRWTEREKKKYTAKKGVDKQKPLYFSSKSTSITYNSQTRWTIPQTFVCEKLVLINQNAHIFFLKRFINQQNLPLHFTHSLVWWLEESGRQTFWGFLASELSAL